mgnify:CR=1 FL=1
MQGKALVILGNQGHASSVADAAESAGFRVIDSIDISSASGDFLTLIQALKGVDFESTSVALGVGANYLRDAAHAAVMQEYPSAQFPPVVHASAWVSPSSVLNDGAVVLAHGSVGAHCRLGTGSLINTSASLDHDSALGNFASLGPGARTGGNVTVGSRTMVGINAAVLHNRMIGEDSVIGGQSLVVEDLPELCVAYGTPCRVIRQRGRDEKYY